MFSGIFFSSLNTRLEKKSQHFFESLPTFNGEQKLFPINVFQLLKFIQRERKKKYKIKTRMEK